MSSRSKLMVRLSKGIANNGGDVREESSLLDTLSFTESEKAIINPEFLSQERTQKWINELPVAVVPTAPVGPSTTPQKKGPQKLVVYTPSASSTSTLCKHPRQESPQSSPKTTSRKTLGYATNPPRKLALITDIETQQSSPTKCDVQDRVPISKPLSVLNEPATKKCDELQKIPSTPVQPSDPTNHEGTIPKKGKSPGNKTDSAGTVSASQTEPVTPSTSCDPSPMPDRRRSSRKRTKVQLNDPISDSEESLFGVGRSESEDSYQADTPSSNSGDSVQSVHSPANKENHPSRKRGARRSLNLSAKSRDLELAEMDDSDDERHSVPQKKIRKQKNGVKCSREERSMKKYLRNTGQEYEKHVGSKTPVRDARKRRPPHSCTRNKCQDIITDEVGDSIFHEYWEQGSYDKRVTYVSARVEVAAVKNKRPRLPADHEKSHPKSVSNKYFFHINGEAKQVCKQTFLRTLDETDGFLRFAIKKKLASVSGTVSADKRGKRTPPHKLDPSKIEKVKNHILSVPSYKSHYRRAEVGDTRYLPSHLDIKQMYDMYLSDGNPHVSYSTYQRIFNTLGRSFKRHPNDTCQKCDSWKLMINEETDAAKRNEIEKLHNEHLDRAQDAYNLKKEMKKAAETDPTLRVLVFDLEQVLETPFLSCGAAFYLRQLSTFNLTIYDTSTKVSHCYMWCEVDGHRGANEIASCLFYHCLDVIPDTVKKVVLFSDSTTGQNRNSILAAMFLTLVQMHASIQTVEHVFLEVGHTRMEVDSKHSVIERKKSHADAILTPSDWYNTVRQLSSPSPQYPLGKFAVTEMKGEFYDFKSLLKGPLVLRSLTTKKEKFSWMSTRLLRYDATKPGKVFFKSNLKDLGYSCLDFQRAGKAGDYAAKNLVGRLTRCHHLGPLPISKEKKADLMKLLAFIPSASHEFYKSIPTHSGGDDHCSDEDVSGEDE